MTSPLGRRHLPIAAFVLGAAILFGTGLIQTVPETQPSAFPQRPSDHPSFYNDSSIREWDSEALFQIERARELTDIEFAMVFLAAIPNDYTVEGYAVDLFEAWRVGADTNGKGVLYLFVEDQAKMKIEVSYDLEGVFTDGFVASFQEYIRTYFAGKYFGDVVAHLVLSMVKKVQGENIEAPSIPTNKAIAKDRLDFLSGGAGITSSRYFYDLERKLAAILEASPDVINEFEAAPTPEETVERYLRSLANGINYPYLGILNAGSQLMRLEYPYPANELRRKAHDFRRAPTPTLSRSEDLAVARFGDAYVLPLFLRQGADGLWRLDLVKSQLYTTGNRALTRLFPLYHDHHWMFAFPEEDWRRSRVPIPALRNLAVPLQQRITELEARIEAEPGNAALYFELGNLFYFECAWVRAAIDLVEAGLEIEPDHVDQRWLAIAMRYRFPATAGASIHYDHLRRLFPESLPIWREAIGHERDVLRNKTRAREIQKLLNSKKGRS